MIFEKMEKYFEREYNFTRRDIQRNYSWTTPKEMVETAIDRCLGVAMFVQELDVDYEDVEPIYTEYKEKFENLLKES